MADNTLLDLISQDTVSALVASSKQEAVATGAAKQSAEIAEANAKILETVATNQALIIGTQKTAELKAQQATLAAANAAGVDPTAAGDVITKTLTNINAENEVINENMSTIERLSRVSIFEDGPIKWVKAKIDQVGLQAQTDRAVQRVAMQGAQLEQVNKNISQVAQTQRAIAETTTAASVQAATANAAALSLIESNNARIQGLKFNVAEVDAAMNATKDRLQLLGNLNNAQRQEELLQKQLEQLQLSKEEFSWRKQEAEAKKRAIEEGKQLDDYILETINIGRASRGVQPMTGQAAKNQISLFKVKGAGSKELEMDYQNGERSRLAGIPILGATPAESIALLESVPASIAPAREAVIAVLQKARLAAGENKALDPKNPTAISDFINKTVKNEIAMQYARVQSGGDNIFDIGDMRSYLQLSAVKDLPVVTKVLGQAATAGQSLTDPKIVFGLVSSAVKDGTITSTQAADLATVYQLANQVNIASRGLTGLGITVPQNGSKYNAAFGVGKTLNMADPTVITRLLSQDLSKRIYQTFEGSPVNVQFAPRRTQMP